ncbi:hypothetical protein CRG98_048524 [Punica granatum]|uniref:Uncharacterized protein n=1 Tax=Punica granatum TaxID=22663 RepID=A0A2I0HHB5_PUNGR|nr:hypothetical protein CRG98_048524 [Punica granatum]
MWPTQWFIQQKKMEEHTGFAAGAITVHLDRDGAACMVNECVRFGTATALTLMGWAAAVPFVATSYWMLLPIV